jgi:hypothetical protein
MNDKKNIRDLKISIGADILECMHQDGLMPSKTIHTDGMILTAPIASKENLALIMNHYFNSSDYSWKYELEDAGSTSMPDTIYWQNQLADIRVELRNRKKYLKYIRYKNGFGGFWKFCNKTEYHNVLRREAAENNTRIEHYNEEVEDGREKWQLNLPPASPIPELPPYKRNVAQGYF